MLPTVLELPTEWSSSEFDMQSGWGRGMGFDGASISIYGYLKNIGFSVRCLKDN